MKKIGVIFGMETTFPPALVDKINYMNEPGITAELASVGEVRMAEPRPTMSSSIAFRTTSLSTGPT